MAPRLLLSTFGATLRESILIESGATVDQYPTGSRPSILMLIAGMVLEVLLNGGRGATWYTNKGFDGADLRAVSEAVAIVGPIEDLIMDGQLLDVDEFRCDREGVRLGGVRAGDQVALLVSEYRSSAVVECPVKLPAGVPGAVQELTPGFPREVER